MPMSLCSEWIYEVLNYEDSDTNPDVDYMNVYFNYSEEKAGELCYAHAYKSKIEMFYLKRADGLYIYSTEEDEYYMEAKYPCKVGDSFQDCRGSQCTVESVNAEVECGLGIKKAIKYKKIDTDGDMVIEYYVPGIGLVRAEYYEGSKECLSDLYLAFNLIIYDTSDDEMKVKSSSNSIQPLALGNRWTYIYTNEDEDHSRTIIMRRRIVKSEQTGSGDIHLLMSFDDEYSFMQKSDGIHRCDVYGEYLSIKYPAAKGDKYEAYIDKNKLELEVAAVDELVKTEAGEFKAVKYISEIKDGHISTNFVFYYSEGIGLIKQEEVKRYEGGGLVDKVEMELKSYNLK